MGAKQLTIYRGDDKVYDVTVKDSDGNVVDITNHTIKFTVRHAPADAVAEIAKTTGGGGIAIVDAPNGVARITLSDVDTDLDAGKYFYDVEVTDVSGRTTTVILDNFVVKSDVSR